MYLYPRVVAAGNYSRVGLARVIFEDGDPVGVERMGYVLEPTEGYERNERTAGVEDPRITYIAAIDTYVMAYAAYGPRAALAVSDDAVSWRRLGLAKFADAPEYHTDFDLYVNKDVYLFPEPVRDPHGRLALGMIHRPHYNMAWWLERGYHVQPTGIAEPHPSMWISYTPLDVVRADLRNLQFWYDHQLLAVPQQSWESLKIGGGTPPVLTHLGWLTIFHGVDGTLTPGTDHRRNVRYCVGVLILDRNDPRTVRYRSPTSSSHGSVIPLGAVQIGHERSARGDDVDLVPGRIAFFSQARTMSYYRRVISAHTLVACAYQTSRTIMFVVCAHAQ